MGLIGDIGKKFEPSEVYKSAFGYTRPPYPLLIADSKTYGISPVGTVRALGKAFSLKSVMGVEYTFPTKLDGWQLPNEPTISIRGGKRVVETEINRLDPATNKIEKKNVLEEISLGNYQLRLQGVIISEEYDRYPFEDMNQLRSIIEKPGAVSMDNELASIFNITKVAILDFDFFEVKGYAGQQAYSLLMLSDYDLSLDPDADEPERS